MTSSSQSSLRKTGWIREDFEDGEDWWRSFFCPPWSQTSEPPPLDKIHKYSEAVKVKYWWLYFKTIEHQDFRSNVCWQVTKRKEKGPNNIMSVHREVNTSIGIKQPPSCHFLLMADRAPFLYNSSVPFDSDSAVRLLLFFKLTGALLLPRPDFTDVDSENLFCF